MYNKFGRLAAFVVVTLILSSIVENNGGRLIINGTYYPSGQPGKPGYKEEWLACEEIWADDSTTPNRAQLCTWPDKFYYDYFDMATHGTCKEYDVEAESFEGVCYGSINRFKTMEECRRTCAGYPKNKIVHAS